MKYVCIYLRDIQFVYLKDMLVKLRFFSVLEYVFILNFIKFCLFHLYMYLDFYHLLKNEYLHKIYVIIVEI